LRQQPSEVLLGIAALGKAYREGRLSPVDVIIDAIDRAEASQATINAFTTICRQDAVAEAQALGCALSRGEAVGPLAGVPITVKDILATKGVRTAMGSPAFADHVPTTDTVSVSRLRSAGAILVGKTTTPEFACKQTTNSVLSGVTRNPWKLDLSPGGSSGGSSASIAAGIGLVSLVTDGGGSARLPAACTGIVGLKPTFGLIPFESASDAFAGLGHIGLMARNVEDVAAALMVTAGPHSGDPNSLSREIIQPPLDISAKLPLAGLRVGWRDRLNGERISPIVLQPALAGLSVLEELGAVVERAPGEVEPPLPIWQVLQHVIWAERHARRPPDLPQIDPVIATGMAHAETLSARSLQAALHGRTRLFRRVQSWFDRFDILVTPTLTRPPLPATHPGSGDIEIDGCPAGDIRAAWAPTLGLLTMTGHPALSLNCGWTDDGLPIGLQLVGRWHQDWFLLRAARLLQNSMPHAAWRMPPFYSEIAFPQGG
jgi:aspartyl-tRNA(Asn)/glutamyl-tRNA(Gln) amidotransferase subunit A